MFFAFFLLPLPTLINYINMYTSRFSLILLSLLLALPLCMSAKKRAVSKTYIYRYYLTDKQSANHSIGSPRQFLSQRSLERRQRQGIAVDSADLPVPSRYLRQFNVSGASIVGTSRWLNTVVVRSEDSLLLQRLAALPIVREARLVYVSPDSIEVRGDIRWNVHESFNRWDSVRNDPYGMARQQIEMLGGVALHEAGFTGSGMVIAIIDGGFQNFHRIPALRQARILGIHDFVNPGDDQTPDYPGGRPFHRIDHGTKVFSAIAAKAPEVIMGTAPDASFWLLRSEDDDTEQPVEEDYWVMAAEFADSVGADVISSSLGYYDYDAPLPDYRLRDLNGQTAHISRAASMIAAKGMVLCNSAGNSGMGPWKKIGVPADAMNILTVGAVDGDGQLAAFSSVGPSQDGRVKPDIVARGSNTTLLSGRGTLVHDMGTSFSTPVASGMVACLWQALPGLTAFQLMNIIRQSADRHDAPDNIYGYGLPNFWQAYNNGTL